MADRRAEIALLTPDWPAPLSVRAIISTRNGGVASSKNYGANLALHVDDEEQNVINNRTILKDQTGISNWPWLRQVHGIDIANVNAQSANRELQADGAYTDQKNIACAVLTADCLPILLCNVQGTEVAALHAGWKGLCAGIIQRGVARFKSPPNELLAFFGPAIGPNQFEVGEDVRQAFILSLQSHALGQSLMQVSSDPEELQPFIAQCFRTHAANKNKYLANIYQMAQTHLNLLGVHHVFGGAHCTVSEAGHFFSYRRDHITGRFVSAIWLTG